MYFCLYLRQNMHILISIFFWIFSHTLFTKTIPQFNIVLSTIIVFNLNFTFCFQNQACDSISCQGSLMTPKTLIWNPKLAQTAHNEILPRAIDLINQLFKSKVK